MAIEKNSFKVVAGARLDSELSSRSREESISSEDDELQRPGGVDSDDELNDCDSGAGSDDFDLLELGETGEEFCQIGDQTSSIPLELYDLLDLGDILSMDVWNDVLTDDERLGLAKYLPDMDQETFMRTMKELFTGCNFHFGVPVSKLFNMLKGGLCEPRVALYRQGLMLFQKHQHYHVMRKHQNTMVNNLFQIREAWMKCRGYSIEEKIRVLNIMRSQKSLMYENMEELETDSSDWEDYNFAYTEKPKSRKKNQGLFPAVGRQLASEPANYRKQNPKGTLKVSGSKMPTTKESGDLFPSHGSASVKQMMDQFRGEAGEETMYEVSVHGDHNFSGIGEMDKGGKNFEGLRDKEYTGSFMGLPVAFKNDMHAFGRNRTVNQLSDIKVLTTKPSSTRSPYDYYGNKLKYPEDNQQFPGEDSVKYGKLGAPNLSRRGSLLDMHDRRERFWQNKLQGEPVSVNLSSRCVDGDINIKKGRIGNNTGEFQYNDELLHRLKQEKGRRVSMQNGGGVVAAAEGMRMLAKGEETESDSSEQFGEDDDDNPLMRSKFAYPSGVSSTKSGADFKKGKSSKKDKKTIESFDGSARTSRKIGDFGGRLPPRGEEVYSVKAKQKGKTHGGVNYSNNSSVRGLEESYMLGASKFNTNGHVQGEQPELFQVPLLKTYPVGKKQKGKFEREGSVLPSIYLNDYVVDGPGSSVGMHQLVRDNVATGRSAKKGQKIDVYAQDFPEMTDVRLLGCNSVSKKRKVKDELMYVDEPEDHDDESLGRRKWEDESTFENVKMEGPAMDTVEDDADLESKSQKKPFTLITPTIHKGFSFSVIHLLSAVRMAMITLLPEDSLDVGRQNLREEQKQEGVNGVHSGPSNPNLPSLTVQDIVNRVRSNPGDPCILETQEPLHDLVRGVLKVFSSRTAPLGAKGWKALVIYEKPTKSWSWIGPVSQSSSDHDTVEEVTSPDSWNLPYKMLVKLVDSFANWLKSGQETLQQIGSLPAPPLTLMQLNLDEKERFRDLKAQKSLNTINQSSDEVKDYFRKEEGLRYSIPDRAFAYTAIDGKKSAVAPSRKGAGKPTSKARDHFMLKRDRPPHVTILCLVRDAAARLPGSIGTRADVCTLIRDSQYIVEDVSDAQVNQIVSGALDRLHYERDPCVQYDGERKLWVYLHREREEEDFEDDGTSSTKKWKRQKKEPVEPSDTGAVTLAYHGGIEQDLEANFGANHVSEQGSMHQVHSMAWEAMGLDNLRDNRFLCQENSTNEFDVDTGGRGGC